MKTTSDNIDYETLKAPIEKEFHEFMDALEDTIGNCPEDIKKMMPFSDAYRGKKIRPVTMLLFAKSCGNITQTHIKLAVVIEIIHTATLMHDDVLDESEIRRKKNTINATWGNQRGILLGDYFFATAFSLLEGLDTSLPIELANLTKTISIGEIMQVENQHNYSLTEKKYIDIIEKKTATLFEAAASMGARFAGRKDMESISNAFGKKFGTAYQIVDDLLDLGGNEQKVGKTLGTDIKQGKITLPVIHMLENAEPDTKECLLALLEKAKNDRDMEKDIRDMLTDFGSMGYAKKIALTLLEDAKKAIEPLPSCMTKNSLFALADYSASRCF